MNLNTFFSPTGRLDPSTFLKAAMVVIFVAILLSLPAFLGLPQPVLQPLGILSFVLMYVWIALWIKRYHDGGQSGWMCLVPILVYTIGILVLTFMLMGGLYMEMMEAISEGASTDEVNEITLAMTTSNEQKMLTVAGAAFSFFIAFIFNKMIKHDPDPNQYGPPSSDIFD